jgi:ABC-type antimicrobial peptide transport system permease subunit
MFLVYLRRELRQRKRQTILVAMGMALGIGLVITVSAVSAGLRDAQDTVLHTLSGVGRQLTVTTAPAAQTPVTPTPGPSRSTSPTRPAGGGQLQQDTLFSRRLGPLPASSVGSIGQVSGVTAATGGLTLSNLQVSTGAGTPGPTAGRASPAIGTRLFTVSGVDLSRGDLGALSATSVKSGRTFDTTDAGADLAVVDADYASQQRLSVGSTVTVGGARIPVIGVVAPQQGTAPSDVYLPLKRTQQLAGMTDQVNIVYVLLGGATDVAGVRKAISGIVPGATTTTADDLANAISGSLTTASNLAGELGRWLASAALAAAFLIAILLTMTTVNRRVREIGTLKALGWRGRRIVGQVMGEAIVMGMAGGVLGIAFGYAGAALVTALTPTLTAEVSQSNNPAAAAAGGAGAPIAIQLSAPIAPSAIVLAVLLAIAGGLIAGGFGGWRAAQLRPAAALARVA